MIQQTQETVDQGVAHIAATTMYSGAAGAVLFWGLRLSDLGVIVSASVAIAGFVVQIYVSISRERRERELHKTRMETMRNDPNAGSTLGKEARLDKSSGPRQ